MVVTSLAGTCYYTWGYGDGQTVGCILTRMRIVTDRTGLEPGYRTGFARGILATLLLARLGLGYLWMLCEEKHQTWHDKLCSTVAIIDDGTPGEFFG